jgi:hypothetical protein
MFTDLSRRNMHRSAGAHQWGVTTAVGQVDIGAAVAALRAAWSVEDGRTRWAGNGRRA